MGSKNGVGRKKNPHGKIMANFSALRLQRIVVRHTLASVSCSNAPQLHLQHNPSTVSHLGQLREKQATQRWCGTCSNGETFKQTTDSCRMVNQRAVHHKEVFCEALVMVPFMCTLCCRYHGQCRDCNRWQSSSLRWLIRVSFTKADNNGQSLVSCLDQNFYSEKDLLRSDTPGHVQASPSSELVILIHA